ncbi:TPA: hypothetical protein N0F65_009676 [Lagenidium giganteum]|uniref:formate--tetrahydrofolate ligase n=1 Tax=Lagenidium giganteum TaxID=4803 RepID=A0AAV2YUI2_9STRA|nr:TPA: hypothetical protein N0F65_009676 [Lagenidium giganteum]
MMMAKGIYSVHHTKDGYTHGYASTFQRPTMLRRAPRRCLSTLSVTKSWQLQHNTQVDTTRLRQLMQHGKFPSDSDIAACHTPRAIQAIAHDLGILDDELELHGRFKAKINLKILQRLGYGVATQQQQQKAGKYVVVGGITPTPLGEGKTTCALGLVQALNMHLQRPAIACIRQPSQGPIFGIKGGAAGGGFSQVLPMDEFNLHLTGDIHAVTAANNLLAAAIDARMFHERNLTDKTLFNRLVCANRRDAGGSKARFTPSMLNRLRRLGIAETDPLALNGQEQSKFARLSIDPATVAVTRVIDSNDRMLRGIQIGRGVLEKGFTRDTSFEISVASELMAIIALSTSIQDMKARIARMVIAMDTAGQPLTTEDLGVDGALAALLRDAIKPTLMQSLDGSPVLVHAGPFANIAHGNSSVLADQIGVALVGGDGFVITEAGFGADMGVEKFCHIKCRASALQPDCGVIVATVRALKLHGGAPAIVAGKALPLEYTVNRPDLVAAGCCNLHKQIDNMRAFGMPVVVAISPFLGDSEEELETIRSEALRAGADDAVVAHYHTLGGAGAVDLAEAVVRACNKSSSPLLSFL